MILAIDIGTTSTKAVITDLSFDIIASVSHPTPTIIRPRLGWMEHDADVDWWQHCCAVIQSLKQGSPKAFAAIRYITLSGMWLTFLPCDDSGKPLCRASLYNDCRAVEVLASIDPERTQFPDGFEWIPKLLWLQRHDSRVFDQIRRVFTVHNYLSFRLTGEYCLDHHTAQCLGGLYDVVNHRWNPRTISHYGLEMISWPRILPPGAQVGTLTAEAARSLDLNQGVVVLNGTGDTFASLLSSAVSAPGDTMLYYGTVGHMIQLLAPVEVAILCDDGRLDTDKLKWVALFANLGRHIQWIADVLKGCCEGSDKWKNLELLLQNSQAGSNGTQYVVDSVEPDATPLLSPDVSQFTHLTSLTRAEDLARAVIEYFATRIRDSATILDPACRLFAAGGVTKSRAIMKIISGCIDRPQFVTPHTESSIGTALLAVTAVSPNRLEDIQRERIKNGVMISSKPDTKATIEDDRHE